MYCQICRYKPVKTVLSSLWRQNIIHRPERKCQHIDPDKLWNQWHCPVQWCGKIKMISVRCQYATAPVNQTIQHKNTYQWQDWPNGRYFSRKNRIFSFLVKYLSISQESLSMQLVGTLHDHTLFSSAFFAVIFQYTRPCKKRKEVCPLFFNFLSFFF